MYARNQSVGYLINQAARLTHKTMRNQMGSESLHPAYIPIILWLLERSGQTQIELCIRAGIEQPSMAELLKRMQRDGLLISKTDPVDKRRQRYLLTPKAKRHADALLPWLEAHNAAISEGISEADLTTFTRVLMQMIENMERSVSEE